MKVIVTLVFTFQVCWGFAQQNDDIPVRENSISVSLGYEQFKDENLHPKVFRGLSVGASYRHTLMNKNISEYMAGFKFSVMNTVYEDFPAALSTLILGNYRYLFTIFRNEDLSYYLGPAADFQFGTNGYFNWDESHLYFANYLGAGIGNRIRYHTGNRSFDFDLEIPFFSCIFRPEYNRQYKIDDMTFSGIFTNLTSNAEVALPDKNFYLKTGLAMKYLVKNRKTRSVGYHFRYHYMQATHGNPYQNIEHALSYKFFF